MKSETWLRFIKSMMPKTSVSPAATKKSRSASWTPLSVCSMKSDIEPVIKLRLSLCFVSLHRTLLVKGILHVCIHRAKRLHCVIALSILDDFLSIEILYREVIAIVPKFAANRLEFRLLQRSPECVLVVELTVRRDDGARDQHRRVVVLR